MAAPSVGRRSCAGQRETAALISQNRRWGMFIEHTKSQPARQRFFSFPVGRGRLLSCIKNKKEPITTSKSVLCVIGSASVRLAL